jgi:cysteine synthase
MEKVLRRLIGSLGTGGAVANVASSLEDRRTKIALVDEACRRLAGVEEEQAAA